MADAVVIGAGPNGLVAANVLADHGWQVVVLEAQPEPGGAVRSAELTKPGFVHDRFSAFYPLAAASPPMRRLELERYGLRWARAPLAVAHPTASDDCAVLSTDFEETAASLDKFASGDGDGWRTLYDRWERVGGDLLDALLSPFPPVRATAKLAARLGPRGLLDLGRFAVLPVGRMAEEVFAGEGGRLLLTGCALHTDLGPDVSGGGLPGWLLACVGQEIGFPVPEGGAMQLTEALVRRLAERGGEVICGAEVSRIITRGRRAVAVLTTDGMEVDARRGVLADTGAPQLYRDLVGPEHLPPAFSAALEHFEYDHGTIKVDWALDGKVPWRAEPVRRAGTVHVSDSMDEISDYAAQLATQRIPAHPYLVVGQMTTADPTRSPAGTETLWAYSHVPARPRLDSAGEIDGDWNGDTVRAFADRMETEIEARAPGFRKLIAERHVTGPSELEAADANLVGGALNGGTAALHQQLVFRPTPGWGRPETPVRGLFLASASAHPGGGVHGACGHNAARAALAADRRRRLLGSMRAPRQPISNNRH
ncbi:MAG: phytoene desaturase family protein [Acidimicrobiia bacterium]